MNNVVQLHIAIYNQESLSIIANATQLEKLDIIIKSSSQIKIKKDSIPSCVTRMYLGVEVVGGYPFIGTLESGSLPMSIKNLKIHHLLFKHDPIALIPQSVLDLEIEHWGYTLGDNNNLIPPTVQSLKIETLQYIDPDCLPNTITNLEVVVSQKSLSPEILPKSLKKLRLTLNTDDLEIKIPPLVEDLHFSFITPIS
eukprot:gene5504-6858_t